MTIIVNFNLKKRDPETSLIYLFNIFQFLAQYRDNLKKAYLLPQIIPWLEIDFLPNNPYTGIGSVRYFPRSKIKRFKIDP
jgi:hypothetical protein